MKTQTKNRSTKDELRFFASLQEGLKYDRGLKTKGVIVERHPLRDTKDLQGPAFQKKARRQSKAVATSPHAKKDQAFIDAVSIPLTKRVDI
jgi:hypothetical protein